MNRTYDTERYFSILGKLRDAIPDIAVTTDIIVGFPSETEEDFEKTMAAVERARFDAAYCFVYSDRTGTVASRMSEKISDGIKSERIQRLLARQNDISLEKNLPLVGRRLRVLVDSVSKKDAEVYTARTDTNKTVHLVSDENIIGEVRTYKEYKKVIKNVYIDDMVEPLLNCEITKQSSYIGNFICNYNIIGAYGHVYTGTLQYEIAVEI